MHKNQHLRKMSAVGFSLEMSPAGVNNGATLPSEGQWGWNVVWSWINQHWVSINSLFQLSYVQIFRPKLWAQFLLLFWSSERIFACKHSKKLVCGCQAKWSVWHLWVNERAALAFELDFKNTECGEECCKCNATQTSPNENLHKEWPCGIAAMDGAALVENGIVSPAQSNFKVEIGRFWSWGTK